MKNDKNIVNELCISCFDEIVKSYSEGYETVSTYSKINFCKTVIIRLKSQYGPYRYRNWGMHGEKVLHPRIEDNGLYWELQFSGDFVVYSAWT